jgi:pyrroloquinoline quinone (PQQ) biosynthesis protein C
MSGRAASTVEASIAASAALRQKLALARGGTTARFWTRPDLRAIFPEFLFLTHCIIRASVPLMQAAADVSRSGNSETSRQLAAYFGHHVTEEASHDEWLLDDMQALGLNRAEILSRVPPASVAELVGAQYYWLHHAHPVALLGYVAVLEGDPPREDELEAAARRTGLPHDAFRTFISHAKLDPTHKQELDDFIDSLSMTKQQQSLLGLSALTSVDGLRKVFGNLQ